MHGKNVEFRIWTSYSQEIMLLEGNLCNFGHFGLFIPKMSENLSKIHIFDTIFDNIPGKCCIFSRPERDQPLNCDIILSFSLLPTTTGSLVIRLQIDHQRTTRGVLPVPLAQFLRQATLHPALPDGCPGHDPQPLLHPDSTAGHVGVQSGARHRGGAVQPQGHDTGKSGEDLAEMAAFCCR